MTQLVRRCIDHRDYHYIVAYGVSNNRCSRWNNDGVAFLGYQPQDDSKVFAEAISVEGIVKDPIAARFHGAFFCPLEFTGNVDRIDWSTTNPHVPLRTNMATLVQIGVFPDEFQSRILVHNPAQLYGFEAGATIPAAEQ
jgi:hypothetical protein